MKFMRLFYALTSSNLSQVLKKKLQHAETARAKTLDDRAYAKAMLGYHTAQVEELIPSQKKLELFEAQLLQLEAQEAVQYADLLCVYYTKRVAELLSRINGPARTDKV